MNESEIKQIVQELISRLSAEGSAAQPAHRCYIVFGEHWKNCFYPLFDEIQELHHCEFYAVIPGKWMENGNRDRLRECRALRDIVRLEDRGGWPQGDYTLIMADFDHDLAAKTALGINDTLILNLIFKAMKDGQQIALLKPGLESFSGREPELYTKTILGYYVTLKEYNIKLFDSMKAIGTKAAKE